MKQGGGVAQTLFTQQGETWVSGFLMASCISHNCFPSGNLIDTDGCCIGQKTHNTRILCLNEVCVSGSLTFSSCNYEYFEDVTCSISNRSQRKFSVRFLTWFHFQYEHKVNSKATAFYSSSKKETQRSITLTFHSKEHLHCLCLLSHISVLPNKLQPTH